MAKTLGTFTGIVVLILLLDGLSNLTQAQELYTNPVKYGNCPDPGVLALPNGEGYVAVTTSDRALKKNGDPLFPMLKSPDLVNWEEVGHVFPKGNWPKWAYIDMWAPEIHFVGGRYVVYFSGREVNTKQYCIGMAISKNATNPLGPYEDHGKPIVEDVNGAIDITWFRDPKTNYTYLSWKNNGVLLDKAALRIRRVEEDGFTMKPEWETHTLFKSDRFDDGWVIEAPWIVYRDPYYYMFFSANLFLFPIYHVDVARSTSVTGPYTRYDKQILHVDFKRLNNGQNCTFVGPGHGSVVRTPAGEDWFVYHSWLYRQIMMAPGRVMMLDRITWTSDGWPHIGVPSDTPKPVPSVESTCEIQDQYKIPNEGGSCAPAQ